jgi:hypothetical protein
MDWRADICVRDLVVYIAWKGGSMMNRLLKSVPVLMVLALIAGGPVLGASWIKDGVGISTRTTSEADPRLVEDGMGGAIITWKDCRNPSWDIYAQRVSAVGVVQWTTDGIPICTAVGTQQGCWIASDGAGGAIVTWNDQRSGTWDVYAQRVNAAGTVLWATDGIAICTASGSQGAFDIISDGAGGAIIVWVDGRSGNGDIYAQRVDALGTVLWTANGAPVCTAQYDQNYAGITSDGAGGAIIAWRDGRTGTTGQHIYAQRMTASGTARWTANGVPICTADDVYGQSGPIIVSDSEGGAIIAWDDYRGSLSTDIYAQRVDSLGAVQWTYDGVPVCTTAGSQMAGQICTDDAGGAIIAWVDDRAEDENYDVYAQRVDASGTVQWISNGVPISQAEYNQQEVKIASDGAGGAFITWHDYRNPTYDVYAQRVNALGAVLWTVDGVAVSTAAGGQVYPQIISYGDYAIITWYDYRDGGYLYPDIYAQRITSQGVWGYPQAQLSNVWDIPDDQGGWVRITMDRSRCDDPAEAEYPILMYNVWQRIDDVGALAALASSSARRASCTGAGSPALAGATEALRLSGWPVHEWGGRCFVDSRHLLGTAGLPPGTWELLGSFAACQQEQYIYRASTLADSSASGIAYSVYVVSAHSTTPAVWFMSEPDSGYSVDNLAPSEPGALTAEQSFEPEGLHITWAASADPDLHHYAVHRETRGDFEPAPENLIASPSVPHYFDDEWRWNSDFYYKICSVDVHGNLSAFSLLQPGDATGTETPKAPEATYLAQNFPNPFNPMTRIEYGLSAPAHVSLRLYDAAGRLVRELVDEPQPAARYVVAWDGRDDVGRRVSSGMYFYRLTAGSFTETRKMILLR